MSRHTRENISFVLFFPALTYLIARGWEKFLADGATGKAWLELMVPSVLMTLALLIWPRRGLTPGDESE